MLRERYFKNMWIRKLFTLYQSSDFFSSYFWSSSTTQILLCWLSCVPKIRLANLILFSAQSSWTLWTACSVPVGFGLRGRNKACVNLLAGNETVDRKHCLRLAPNLIFTQVEECGFGEFPPTFYRPFCPQHLYSTFPKYDLLRLQLTVSPPTELRMLSHNETVILSYICGDPISYSLSN